MSKFDRNYTKWTKEAIDDFLDDNPSYKKMRKKIEVDEDGSIHIKGTMMIFKNAVTSWKDSRYFTEGKLKLDPRKYKDPKRKDTLAGKLGMKSPRSKKYDKKKNEERMSFDAYLAEDELIELWKQGKLDESAKTLRNMGSLMHVWRGCHQRKGLTLIKLNASAPPSRMHLMGLRTGEAKTSLRKK
jgi:hypothetical protein